MGNFSCSQSQRTGKTFQRPVHEQEPINRSCSENLGTLRLKVPAMEHRSFMVLAQCLSPLLAEIGSFLAEKPNDLVPAFVLSARWLADEVAPCMNNLWAQMYSARWPAFYDFFRFNEVVDWCSAYEDMIYSRCRCQLEVFEREKKAGFDMAAMPAVVTYEGGTDTYAAKYLSASEVDIEIIPSIENYRLRFCPLSARQRLQPFYSHRGEGRPPRKPQPKKEKRRRSTFLRTLSRFMGSLATHEGSREDAGAKTSDSDLPLHISEIDQMACHEMQTSSGFHASVEVDRTGYPYKVLEGFEGLVVGQHVELQWKMQKLSPFGWWFGKLESLHLEENGKTATAVLTFAHFPEHSGWHRLSVRFGDRKVRPCNFGGFSGGLRAVSNAEKDRWMRFLPQSTKHLTELQNRQPDVA
mmetsp:Transcript_24196/g.38672  ORF Transcript_24196/g.38672 Transcript_24196/m.38672 type:complete len:410 (+) Transcript_24196:56-1285(+)